MKSQVQPDFPVVFFMEKIKFIEEQSKLLTA